MRVAVCLTGHLRLFEKNYRSLRRSFERHFDEVDLYIVTYDQLFTSDHERRKLARRPTTTIDPPLRAALNSLNPRIVEIEDYQALTAEYTAILEPLNQIPTVDLKHGVVGSVMQWAQIGRCLSLVDRPADLIIRFRLDSEVTEAGHFWLQSLASSPRTLRAATPSDTFLSIVPDKRKVIEEAIQGLPTALKSWSRIKCNRVTRHILRRLEPVELVTEKLTAVLK